jgi:nitrous oxidase accessory protein NosD
VALAAGALALSASPALAKTSFVDDDGAQCPKAAFTSIQAAVTVASPNDTVKVCPGTYAEQVRIEGKDKLRLESLNPLAATIEFPPAPNPTGDNALVRITDSDRVVVHGFVITGPYTNPGCTDPENNNIGVFVDNSFDAEIRGNHITQIKNSLPSLFGCQDGLAVLVGDSAQDSVGSADVDHNLIDEYQKNGVTVDNAGSFANVDHKVIRAAEDVQPFIAPNGIQVSNGAGAHVDHNRISENIYGPSTIGDFAGTGILLDAPQPGGVRVDHNEVFDNDDGISSYDSDQQEIAHNHSHDNRVYDGLFFDSLSEGNLVKGNDAFGNSEHDCHDDSAGTGTAGTANTWKGNRGETQNRDGLCEGATTQ